MEKKFKVEGMNCQHCVKAIEIELEELNLDSFDVEIASVKVKFDESKVSEKEMVDAIDDAGFKVV